ncbi:MAG: hypothetical protein AAGA56_07620 [Myxococcota bacterium]
MILRLESEETLPGAPARRKARRTEVLLALSASPQKPVGAGTVDGAGAGSTGAGTTGAGGPGTGATGAGGTGAGAMGAGATPGTGTGAAGACFAGGGGCE